MALVRRARSGRGRGALLAAIVLLVLCVSTLVVLNRFQQSLGTMLLSFSDDTSDGPTTNLTPRQQAMQKRSLTAPPVKSYVDGHREEVVVPARFLTVLDDDGACLLPGAEYCDKFRRGEGADLHVDQSIMSVLKGRCTPTTRVWDFGGNIGYYTLFMRAMGCHVTTVEPQPAMNKFHKDSLEANGWDQDHSVVLHEKGVSDTSGTIKLWKLWQPGKKSAGSMNVETITIAELAKETPVVEILKLDIDGPEVFTLRGIAALLGDSQQLVVKNIIAELSVGFWDRLFKFGKATIEDLFDKYYEAGYRMLLVYESQFPLYSVKTMSKLHEIRNFRELVHSYEIPRKLIGEVLYMNNAVTKNIFMTRDPVLISELDSLKSA